MDRRQSWKIATTLAGLVTLSCGDHQHQISPGNTTPMDATVPSDVNREIDAAGEATAMPDSGAAAALDGGPTGLWIADPTSALAAQSPACLECAMANCPIYLSGCATIAGEASTGPAKGMSKADLCVEALSCALSSGCLSCPNPSGCVPVTRYGNCYCLWEDPSAQLFPWLCQEPTPDIVGPCKAALERSLEASGTSAVMASFGDPSKGGGWATLLLQCLVDNRCQSCFPTPDAGFDASDGATP